MGRRLHLQVTVRSEESFGWVVIVTTWVGIPMAVTGPYWRDIGVDIRRRLIVRRYIRGFDPKDLMESKAEILTFITSHICLSQVGFDDAASRGTPETLFVFQ